MSRILAFVFLVIAGAASADDWRPRDTVLEVTWQALNLIDMGTTLDAAKTEDRRIYWKEGTATYSSVIEYEELNPVIGRKPDADRVVLAMTAGAIAHAGISYLLPHGWRDAWQYLTIGTSAYCVHKNYELGLKVNF